MLKLSILKRGALDCRPYTFSKIFALPRTFLTFVHVLQKFRKYMDKNDELFLSHYLLFLNNPRSPSPYNFSFFSMYLPFIF